MIVKANTEKGLLVLLLLDFLLVLAGAKLFSS